MPNEVRVKSGTIFVIANSTYVPDTDDSLGTITDDIDVVGLTTGQAREGVKIDLGATRAAAFSVDIAVEMATDPTAGDTIDLYWSASASASAAVGNMGPDVTGADADYAGTGHGYPALADALNQMQFIGSLRLAIQNDTDGVQLGHVGVFVPTQRYGVLIFHNNSAVSLHSDSVEMAIRFTPIVDEIQ